MEVVELELLQVEVQEVDDPLFVRELIHMVAAVTELHYPLGHIFLVQDQMLRLALELLVLFLAHLRIISHFVEFQVLNSPFDKCRSWGL